MVREGEELVALVNDRFGAAQKIIKRASRADKNKILKFHPN